MEIPVIGLGAGGHARVMLEALRFDQTYKLIGFLDRDPALIKKDVLGVPVIGNDDLLLDISSTVKHFFIGLGSTGPALHRVRLFSQAINLNMTPINIIHPNSIISPSATLGSGVAVLAGAIINACVSIGNNVVINTGAIVEHDSVIGDHVHVATGARLCGAVNVEREVHIGAGATILQGVKIGANSIVGAGAVVLRDVPAGVTVVGVPARIISK
jgi:UDP-perosamine 4-acetyltransferase